MNLVIFMYYGTLGSIGIHADDAHWVHRDVNLNHGRVRRCKLQIAVPPLVWHKHMQFHPLSGTSTCSSTPCLAQAHAVPPLVWHKHMQFHPLSGTSTCSSTPCLAQAHAVPPLVWHKHMQFHPLSGTSTCSFTPCLAQAQNFYTWLFYSTIILVNVPI